MGRRGLLAGGAAAFGVLALDALEAEVVAGVHKGRLPRKVDVVVVGAGIAGLVAARQVRGAGHSVLVSGLAVLISMFGLYLADDTTFDALATGSMIVVAVAVLGSLTVLPAVLVKLGRGIDRPRVPVLWRLTAQDRPPRFWRALLRPSLDHPARTLILSVLALGAVALPALGMKLASENKNVPTGLEH